MAERRDFGALPPSGVELSNSLLADIRDKLANLSQLSSLITVLQQSFSKQSDSASSLTVIEGSSSTTVQSLESIKEKLDTEILGLSSLTTLLTTQLDVLLSSRASDSTLQQSNVLLSDVANNITTFNFSFDELKQENGGQKNLRVVEDYLRPLVTKQIGLLEKINTQLALITEEEIV